VAQVERHMPSLLDVEATTVAPTVEMPAFTRLPRLRFSRLRRLRRAA
jgi:hypothetical protein